MDKKEVIDNLNLTKQRINEGSKAVRDQIDFHVIPLVKENFHVYDLVMDARRIFTSGDQEAKRKIDEVIKIVIGSGNVPVLRDELTVLGMLERFGYPIYIAPFLIPSIHLNQQIKREDLVRFADWMVKNEWGNCIRFLGTFGWEEFWYQPDYLVPVYQKSGDKWNCLKRNPGYTDIIKDRVKIFTDRHISVIRSLGDNCARHYRRKGFWAAHPWNGNNNVNGTSDWNNMIYHFYEDEHKDKPGAKETGEITRAQYKFDVRLLEEFAPYVIYEPTNEAFAGHQWQKMLSDIIDVAAGHPIPQWRKICSMSRDEFYKKQIYTYMNYSLHKIGNFQDYLERKELIPSGVRAIMSQDGCPPTNRHEETAEMVYKVLTLGELGFEQNLRPIWENIDGRWQNVCGHEDWSLDLKWGWANAVRDGWFRFLINRVGII